MFNSKMMAGRLRGRQNNFEIKSINSLVVIDEKIYVVIRESGIDNGRPQRLK